MSTVDRKSSRSSIGVSASTAPLASPSTSTKSKKFVNGRRVYGFLTIMNEVATEATHVFGVGQKVIRIGRGSKNDIRLNARMFSRHHATLTITEQGDGIQAELKNESSQKNATRVLPYFLPQGNSVVLDTQSVFLLQGRRFRWVENVGDMDHAADLEKKCKRPVIYLFDDTKAETQLDSKNVVEHSSPRGESSSSSGSGAGSPSKKRRSSLNVSLQLRKAAHRHNFRSSLHQMQGLSSPVKSILEEDGNETDEDGGQQIPPGTPSSSSSSEQAGVLVVVEHSPQTSQISTESQADSVSARTSATPSRRSVRVSVAAENKNQTEENVVSLSKDESVLGISGLFGAEEENMTMNSSSKRESLAAASASPVVEKMMNSSSKAGPTPKGRSSRSSMMAQASPKVPSSPMNELNQTADSDQTASGDVSLPLYVPRTSSRSSSKAVTSTENVAVAVGESPAKNSKRISSGQLNVSKAATPGSTPSRRSTRVASNESKINVNVLDMSGSTVGDGDESKMGISGLYRTIEEENLSDLEASGSMNVSVDLNKVAVKSDSSMNSSRRSKGSAKSMNESELNRSTFSEASTSIEASSRASSRLSKNTTFSSMDVGEGTPASQKLATLFDKGSEERKKDSARPARERELDVTIPSEFFSTPSASTPASRVSRKSTVAVAAVASVEVIPCSPASQQTLVGKRASIAPTPVSVAERKKKSMKINEDQDVTIPAEFFSTPSTSTPASRTTRKASVAPMTEEVGVGSPASKKQAHQTPVGKRASIAPATERKKKSMKVNEDQDVTIPAEFFSTPSSTSTPASSRSTRKASVAPTTEEVAVGSPASKKLQTPTEKKEGIAVPEKGRKSTRLTRTKVEDATVTDDITIPSDLFSTPAPPTPESRSRLTRNSEVVTVPQTSTCSEEVIKSTPKKRGSSTKRVKETDPADVTIPSEMFRTPEPSSSTPKQRVTRKSGNTSVVASSSSEVAGGTPQMFPKVILDRVSSSSSTATSTPASGSSGAPSRKSVRAAAAVDQTASVSMVGDKSSLGISALYRTTHEMNKTFEVDESEANITADITAPMVEADSISNFMASQQKRRSSRGSASTTLSGGQSSPMSEMNQSRKSAAAAGSPASRSGVADTSLPMFETSSLSSNASMEVATGTPASEKLETLFEKKTRSSGTRKSSSSNMSSREDDDDVTIPSELFSTPSPKTPENGARMGRKLTSTPKSANNATLDSPNLSRLYVSPDPATPKKSPGRRSRSRAAEQEDTVQNELNDMEESSCSLIRASPRSSSPAVLPMNGSQAIAAPEESFPAASKTPVAAAAEATTPKPRASILRAGTPAASSPSSTRKKRGSSVSFDLRKATLKRNLRQSVNPANDFEDDIDEEGEEEQSDVDASMSLPGTPEGGNEPVVEAPAPRRTLTPHPRAKKSTLKSATPLQPVIDENEMVSVDLDEEEEEASFSGSVTFMSPPPPGSPVRRSSRLTLTTTPALFGTPEGQNEEAEAAAVEPPRRTLTPYLTTTTTPALPPPTPEGSSEVDVVAPRTSLTPKPASKKSSVKPATPLLPVIDENEMASVDVADEEEKAKSPVRRTRRGATTAETEEVAAPPPPKTKRAARKKNQTEDDPEPKVGPVAPKKAGKKAPTPAPVVDAIAVVNETTEPLPKKTVRRGRAAAKAAAPAEETTPAQEPPAPAEESKSTPATRKGRAQKRKDPSPPPAEEVPAPKPKRAVRKGKQNEASAAEDTEVVVVDVEEEPAEPQAPPKKTRGRAARGKTVEESIPSGDTAEPAEAEVQKTPPAPKKGRAPKRRNPSPASEETEELVPSPKSKRVTRKKNEAEEDVPEAEVAPPALKKRGRKAATPVVEDIPVAVVDGDEAAPEAMDSPPKKTVRRGRAAKATAPVAQEQPATEEAAVVVASQPPTPTPPKKSTLKKAAGGNAKSPARRTRRGAAAESEEMEAEVAPPALKRTRKNAAAPVVVEAAAMDETTPAAVMEPPPKKTVRRGRAAKATALTEETETTQEPPATESETTPSSAEEPKSAPATRKGRAPKRKKPSPPPAEETPKPKRATRKGKQNESEGQQLEESSTQEAAAPANSSMAKKKTKKETSKATPEKVIPAARRTRKNAAAPPTPAPEEIQGKRSTRQRK